MKIFIIIFLSFSLMLVNVYAVDPPTGLTIDAICDDQVKLNWTLNLSSDSVLIVYNISNSFDTPTDGISYNNAYIFPSGAEVIYKGTDLSFNHNALTPNTWYYYQIWSFDGGHLYSTGIIDSIKTQCVKLFLGLYSGFENSGSIPSCWREEFVTGTTDWTFTEGNTVTNKPDSAYNGDYCAVFRGIGEKTKLILPTFNFDTVSGSVILTFRAFTTEDNSLKVYYKSSYYDVWTCIQTINRNDNWANYVLALSGLSEDYYIAFEGYSSASNKGLCIDEVKVIIEGDCPLPTQPGLTINDGCCSFPAHVYANSAGATNYEWSVTEGYINGGGSNNIEVYPTNCNISFPACGFLVCVTPINICGYGQSSIGYVCFDNYLTNSSTLTVIGNTNPCIGSTQTYTVSNVASFAYEWGYPGNWIPISTDNTAPNLSITFIVGSGSGTVILFSSYMSTCCSPPTLFCPNGQSNYLSVIPINVPSQPSLISGNSTPCVGSTLTYAVTNVSGVSYNWTVPSGWVINSGQGTYHVSVTVGSGSGNISVTPGNTCGSGIARTLAVNPIPLPAQPSEITGNTSVCESDTITYSVINETGINYTWVFPAGWTQISGGNTNSVTVISGNTSGNIIVTPSNTCGNGISSTLTIVATALPDLLSGVSGPDDPCVNSMVIYSITGSSVTDYSWEIPAGWVLLSGNGTQSISVTSGLNSGYVVITPNNSCGAGTPDSIFVFPDVILNNPDSVYGPEQICTGTSQTYIVAAFGNSDFYEWIIPPDWTIQGSANNDTLNVIIGNTAGNVGALQGNNCGLSDTAFYFVETITVPDQPDTIFGEIYPCNGSQQIYSVADDTSLTYNWTYPSGWVQIAGLDSSQITLLCSPDTGIITVAPVNVCGAGNTYSYNVFPTDVPQSPVSILGNLNVCIGDTYTYTVEIPTGDYYLWDVPLSWDIISGDSTMSITITISDTSGTITVIPVNDCGQGPSVFIKPSLNDVPNMPVITGNISACEGSTEIYSIMLHSGEYYNWDAPSGYTLLNGQGTDSIEIVIGTISDTIIVTPSNICGLGVQGTLIINPLDLISASVDIYASPDTIICEGESVNLTVTSINAGTSPVYQWFVSDTLYGTSQSIILSSLQNGTDVFIVMTADTSCLNENPINSDTLIFTVFNNPAPPVITLSNDTLNSSYGTGNQWYNNTGLIVGANNQLYVVAIDGDYYVIYTDTNGCYSISDTINVILTKIIKSGNPELVVFPNPADDKIFIYNKCLNNSNIIIEFYDITGQKVYSDVILNIEMTYYNTSSLLPGTYFIFFHSDGYNYHEKVIIY